MSDTRFRIDPDIIAPELFADRDAVIALGLFGAINRRRSVTESHSFTEAFVLIEVTHISWPGGTLAVAGGIRANGRFRLGGSPDLPHAHDLGYPELIHPRALVDADGNPGSDPLFLMAGREGGALFGQDADDRILGGPGQDRLDGRAGHDRLQSGPGTGGVPTGAAGADLFMVDPAGQTVVTDFDPAEGDLPGFGGLTPRSRISALPSRRLIIPAAEPPATWQSAMTGWAQRSSWAACCCRTRSWRPCWTCLLWRPRKPPSLPRWRTRTIRANWPKAHRHRASARGSKTRGTMTKTTRTKAAPEPGAAAVLSRRRPGGTGWHPISPACGGHPLAEGSGRGLPVRLWSAP